MAFRKKQYTDAELLKKLKDGSLPALDFTHEAHVRLVWILRRKKFDKLVFYEVSNIIKNYAQSIGEGQIYHETLTFAAVMIITDRIRASKAQDFFGFIEDNLDLILEFKKLVSVHYSDELINSENARRTFVEPDKLPY